MSRTSAVAVTTAVETSVAPAAPGARERDDTSAVEALRRRLAGGAARDHVVLDFLEDDLREARTALAAVAAYVANVEAALSDAEPSQERLQSLAAGGGASNRMEYLATVLASVRRRVAQVAARM